VYALADAFDPALRVLRLKIKYQNTIYAPPLGFGSILPMQTARNLKLPGTCGICAADLRLKPLLSVENIADIQIYKLMINSH